MYTDEELVIKAQDGDENAFNLLYQKYRGEIHAKVKTPIQNEEDTEDLVQKIFLAVHRALPNFKIKSSFKTWLYRIAQNKIDEELVIRFQDGDEDGFNLLFQKYEGEIHALVKRQIQNYEDTEDLVQDIFLAVYRALANFEIKYSFRTWLYRIAQNKIIDEIRRRGREREKMDLLKELCRKRKKDVLKPEDYVIAEETVEVLMRMIESLPIKQRNVCYLIIAGYKYEEIAVTLDCTVGTVKSRIHRARKEILKKDKVHGYLFDRIVIC